MAVETRLDVLLADPQPQLREEVFVFVTVASEGAGSLSDLTLATFHEAEGLSVILPRHEAVRLQLPYESEWACITLQVASSLAAVGFLAAILPKLAAVGISVNPISAYHHDHLFVPWERRDEALDILQRLNVER